jgi:pimeloyl-ACP methyl ester carboxylesterase
MAWPDETSSTAGTTQSGAAFTAVTINPLGGDDNAQMVVPAGVQAGDPVTVLIASHGHGGSYLTFQNDANSRTVRDMAIDAGWVFISPDMHGNRWGNPTAVADVVRVRDYAAALFDVGKLHLYGQSMGGMAMMQVVAQGVLPEVERLAVIAPACNLGLINNTESTLWSTLRSAYGAATDGSDFDTRVLPYDPVANHSASQYAGIRFKVWASNSDALIPKVGHIDAFVDAGRTVEMESFELVTVTGGHLSADHYRTAEFMSFFADEPVAPKFVRRVLARYILIGRQRHRIASGPPRAIVG